MTSLKRLVVEMILDRGCGNVDHLMPKLTGTYTRKQVLKALSNAQTLGFLWCDVPTKAGRKPRGSQPGVYWPGKKQLDPLSDKLIELKKDSLLPKVASVFELGDPRPEDSFPRVRGTVYKPLGDWEAV